MTKLIIIAAAVYIIGAACCIGGNWLAETVLQSVVKSAMR